MIKKIILYILFSLSSISFNATASSILNSHLSAAWYPKKRKEIIEKIINLSKLAKINYASKVKSETIRAIVVPHAGWEYSGEVAVACFRLLPKKYYKKVIILAPSHFEAFSGIMLPSFKKYNTPLGDLEVEKKDIEKLVKSSKLFLSKKSDSQKVFKKEHSLEIELPFIKYFCEDAKIVPLIVGSIDEENIKLACDNLKKIIDKKTLVLVSSDFTHFGEKFGFVPFEKDINESINELDSLIVNAIEHKSCTQFESSLKSTKSNVCGVAPIRILLKLIEDNDFGACNVELVAYKTSGESEKLPKNSVSYAGIIIGSFQKKLKDKFNNYEKKLLKKNSLKVLKHAVKKEGGSVKVQGCMTQNLKVPSGVFVTLNKKKGGKKELKGCVGNIYNNNVPLIDKVMEMTVAAANDERFERIEKDELDLITAEISCLTKPERIQKYTEIKLGKNGIILEKDAHSAVFLPEVPIEQRWNLIDTLKNLSLKARLDKDSWKDANLKIFETIKF